MPNTHGTTPLIGHIASYRRLPGRFTVTDVSKSGHKINLQNAAGHTLIATRRRDGAYRVRGFAGDEGLVLFGESKPAHGAIV